MTVSVRKTKAMIVTGGNIIARQYTPAYNRRMTGKGLTATSGEEIAKIVCPLCKKELNKGYLADHLRLIHGHKRDYNNNNGEGDTAKKAAANSHRVECTGSNVPARMQYGCAEELGHMPQMRYHTGSGRTTAPVPTTLEVAGLQPLLTCID
jgi:hypothetical protein